MTKNVVGDWLVIRKELAVAYGKSVGTDFIVRVGSTAMREGSPNVKRNRPERDRLVNTGVLIPDENPALYRFSVDHIFSSQSLAAGVVIDGNSNGSHWKAEASPVGENASVLAIFARYAIEAAMDAYDQYRQSGEYGEIFGHSGISRDYWVLSTRPRPDRVYPTQPIVGFLLRDTELNDGWGLKGDATARLHNSGFVIVDGNGDPVSLPNQHEHLIRGAHRIRICALNYYIEPARERGEHRATIRAGTLHDELGLHQEWANVCQALAGPKFQVLAMVPPPLQEGPDQSISTKFTYELIHDRSSPIMDAEIEGTNTFATNLILYGPPGTGKTYATAWEAVRLCIGEKSALPLRTNRDALMSEYRRLSNEGRIEFVTFHQSFSYEDFVEGLRPETKSTQVDDKEGDSDTLGGFRLEARAGVFKIISERARLDTGNTSGNGATRRLDRSRAIYKIALGRRGSEEDHITQALDNSVIHIGWGKDIDWSDDRFEDFEEIRNEWNSKEDAEASGKDPNIEMTYAFRSGLQIEDYVIISDGRDSYRAFGKVTGEYEFDPAASFHPHRRNVEWIWRDDKGTERAAFYSKNFRRQAAYRLDPRLIDWDALERVVIGPEAERPVPSARPHVLIIDEINRANISKVFGELITLLEVDKRLGHRNEIKLRLPYSGVSFGIPANLHIIGTMNTADRSIALLDTALRRRFAFRELMPDPEALKSALGERGLDAENLGGVDLCRLLKTVNERIEYLFDREHQIGHAYFTECNSAADIEDVMRYKVIPLLTEYFFEDWSKVAAVLGDRPNAGEGRFLKAKKLEPPAGLADDEHGGERLRWSVKQKFDLSEFAV